MTNCHRLKLKAQDGKYRLTDVVDIEGMFRIIESIPSKNAEPIKQWLAKLGSERIDETFTKRGYTGNPLESLNIIKNSDVLKERLNKYQMNFAYAQDIEYDEIMKCLETMIEHFEIIAV